MSITLQLPDQLTADVSLRAQRAGKSRDEFVADILSRQLAIERFRECKGQLKKYGEAAGLDTDERVFDAIS